MTLQHGAPPGTSPGSPMLERQIGPVLLTLYGIGVMVGAGIYVLIGEVAGGAGLLSPVVFAVAGIIAAPTALTYAELVVRIPVSAGEAAYVERATGSTVAAGAVGLAIVGVGITSAAAVLQGGIGYLTGFIALSPSALLWPVAILLVALAIFGVIESLTVAGTLTLVEVAGLILVIVAGIRAEPSADWSAGYSGSVPWSGLALATMLAFFAFIGFEDMVNLAEEVRRPSHTLPLAIISALVITTLLYGAVSVAAIRSVGVAELSASDEPLVLVVETLTTRAGWMLGLIAVFATLNGVLAQIVMASRVLFGLGRRLSFVSALHHVHPRFGTPVRATLLVGALVAVTASTVDLERLARLTSLTLLVVFLTVNLALIRIRRQEPTSGFAAPWWVAWFGAITSAAALGVALLSS